MNECSAEVVKSHAGKRHPPSWVSSFPVAFLAAREPAEVWVRRVGSESSQVVQSCTYNCLDIRDLLGHAGAVLGAQSQV